MAAVDQQVTMEVGETTTVAVTKIETIDRTLGTLNIRKTVTEMTTDDRRSIKRNVKVNRHLTTVSDLNLRRIPLFKEDLTREDLDLALTIHKDAIDPTWQRRNFGAQSLRLETTRRRTP